MKKVFLAVLLCFLSVSCVVVPGIAIIGVATTGVVCTNSDDAGPEFIFPKDAGSDKYIGIGAEIKVYSDSAEWRPLKKYVYVIGKVSPGGSANLAGIKTGDVIYSINGRFAEKMSPYEVFSDLMGNGWEIISLYIIDGETGLLKKVVIKK